MTTLDDPAAPTDGSDGPHGPDVARGPDGTRGPGVPDRPGRPGRTLVRSTEVDGVPVLWCHAPGPMRAHLRVRAGWADETLPTRGWTHLVEHLALAGTGRPGDHANGHTDATTTAYHVEGTPERVVDFLADVTRRLADLPVDRLADEVGVLRAEQQGRGGSVFDQLLSWRYGARDYGLDALVELGLSVVPDAEALRHRARSQAVTGNAVLWLSGPPPAGLRLHLPEGPHQPPPDPRRCVAGELPGWVQGGDHRAVGLSVVSRGWSVPALRHLLSARLVDTLRVGLAVAYSPGADYSPLTAGHGWLSLHSDLVGGRQSEGVGPFLRLLEELAGEDGTPGALTEADVESYRAEVRLRADDPYAWAGDLQVAAFDRLMHRDEPDGEAKDVTLEQVRATAREAAASLLVAVPRGLGTYRSGWHVATASTVERVHGVEHREYGGEEVLVGSPEGVTLLTGGAAWTVRPDQAAGVLRWPDGRRSLVGEDGVQVTIEPTLHEGGGDLVRHVDRLFAPHLVVPMAERPPGAVPRPTTTVPGPPPGPGGPGAVTERFDRFARAHRWWALAVLLVVGLVGVVLLAVLGVAAGVPVGVLAAGGGACVFGLVQGWRNRYPATRRGSG